jgi:hypothetical protein
LVRDLARQVVFHDGAARAGFATRLAALAVLGTVTVRTWAPHLNHVDLGVQNGAQPLPLVLGLHPITVNTAVPAGRI